MGAATPLCMGCDRVRFEEHCDSDLLQVPASHPTLLLRALRCAGNSGVSNRAGEWAVACIAILLLL